MEENGLPDLCRISDKPSREESQFNKKNLNGNHLLPYKIFEVCLNCGVLKTM